MTTLLVFAAEQAQGTMASIIRVLSDRKPYRLEMLSNKILSWIQLSLTETGIAGTHLGRSSKGTGALFGTDPSRGSVDTHVQ